jgi:DNA (cytosine-5)-methyltransferase 1
MSSFTFVDLFCGIGGFHHALKTLGGRCVWACDIDKHCQDVYETNFGLRPHGDIREVPPESIPDHDILCGGFPCQPFSTGGHRNAFDDTRGTLFQDVANIVRAKRPRAILLENVKHILKIQGGHVYRTIMTVFTDLGYNMTHVVLSPHTFGVPQKRERVYFLGLRNDLGTPCAPPAPVKVPVTVLDRRAPAKYAISEDVNAVFNAWNEILPVIRANQPSAPIILDYFKDTSDTSGMLKWKRDYIERNRALYQANPEAWDAWLTKHADLLAKRAVYRKLEWQAGKIKQGDTVCKGHFIQVRQSGLRVKPATTFPTLVAVVQTSIVGDQKRYLTPRECARLQSFPDTHQLHATDKLAYKQLGNSVNVNVVQHVADHLLRQCGLLQS